MRHFQMHFLDKNIWTSINVSLKFVPKGQMNNIPALVQIIACNWPGDKPLCEPMAVSLQIHIWVMWHQGLVHWISKLCFQRFLYIATLLITDIDSCWYILYGCYQLNNLVVLSISHLDIAYYSGHHFAELLLADTSHRGICANIMLSKCVQVCVLTSWSFVISMFW